MLEDLIEERVQKLKKLREEKRDPYPAKVERTNEIADVLKNFDAWQTEEKQVSIVGRVRGMRVQGGVMFVDLRDETGQLQIVVKQDRLADFALLRDTLDMGDFLGANGTLMVTKRGERSLEAKTADIITKSLRPIPSEWYGLKDVETRFRERYLDLLLHPELKELFVKKSHFWHEFRSFLMQAEFLEVETPILEPIAGGAEAEPFATHHNALDTDFYLRISHELPLKKLLVGGFEKIFQIGRVFRNEGIDPEHLQDYTHLEFYWAYADYEVLMQMVEKMFKTVIKKVFGKTTLVWRGKKIEWGKKWPRVEYYTVFKKYVEMDLKTATHEALYRKALQEGLKPELELGKGRLIDMLFKKFVRPTMIQPSFLVNPPVEIEPLAKRIPGTDGKVARFQVMACGTELGKGFSELNDPLDQRERFEEQMRLREKGDKEAQELDEDFLTALEYGMPPAAGFGLSERLFAVLVDKPVREMVFFPLMKPKR